VGHVPKPLLLRKFGSARNRTQDLLPLDHRDGQWSMHFKKCISPTVFNDNKFKNVAEINPSAFFCRLCDVQAFKSATAVRRQTDV
jgi:hypothetical protein